MNERTITISKENLAGAIEEFLNRYYFINPTDEIVAMNLPFLDQIGGDTIDVEIKLERRK